MLLVPLLIYDWHKTGRLHYVYVVGVPLILASSIAIVRAISNLGIVGLQAFLLTGLVLLFFLRRFCTARLPNNCDSAMMARAGSCNIRPCSSGATVIASLASASKKSCQCFRLA